MTTVIHVWQRGAIPDDQYVYIGRPSKWGNPFSHTANSLAPHRVASREKAIRQYIDWLANQPELLAAIPTELRGKTLGCWCVPRHCHGDVLARLAEGWTIDQVRQLPLALAHRFTTRPALQGRT